jgi:hypothetical protein
MPQIVPFFKFKLGWQKCCFFSVELLITADLVRSFVQFVATATGGTGKTADVGANDLFDVNVGKKAQETDVYPTLFCLDSVYQVKGVSRPRKKTKSMTHA